jgi:hypothetical protein
MATAMPYIMLGLSAVQASNQKISADKEADAQKDQAGLLATETAEEAKRQSKANKDFEQNQRLKFLKSGVRLEGTPLQVLAETESRGQEQVDAFSKSGGARSRLMSKRADMTSNKGTAQAFGTATNAAGNFARLNQ